MQMTVAPAVDLGALAAAGKLAQNAEAGKGIFPQDPNTHVAQPKWDGWRVIAVVRDGYVDFYSRSGKTYNGKLPDIEAELLATMPEGTILDGEVTAFELTPEGDVIDKWHLVQSVMTKMGGHAAAGKARYAIFDLIAHRSIDARPLAYSQRRQLLEGIFTKHKADLSAVLLTPEVPATEASYLALVSRGFEGAVLKRVNAPYASGQRGHGWVKAKPTKSIEGVVMGFQPGKDGFAGMVGAVIFGQHDEAGVLVERGKVSGMDMRTRLSMTHDPQKWVGSVIEVAHEGVSIGGDESGRFRFPRFKRERKDRDAASVTTHDE